MTMTLITHALVYTPDEVLRDAAVLIEGERIRAVGAASEVESPPDAKIIDASGFVLTPGFIELQFNGAFGEDFTENPEAIWRVAQQLPRFGVTAFLPTVITSPMETIAHAMEVVCNLRPPDFKGALPLGLHVEGPFLNFKKKGAHNPKHLRMPNPQQVRSWKSENGVRLVTLAPELPGAAEVIEQLRGQGVVVSAGHSMATIEEAEEAFEKGVTYGTHLFNAMPTLEHRSPNLTGALLTHSNVIVGMIVDGIHVHPAMIKLAWLAKGNQRITLVTDAMAALGMPGGTYRLGDFDVTVDEDAARLADGTLAGSILRPDQALRNLMAFTGCSLGEALPTLTSNPARVLSLKERGKTAPGFIADLVLMTPDGRIQQTFVRGEVFNPQGE